MGVYARCALRQHAPLIHGLPRCQQRRAVVVDRGTARPPWRQVYAALAARIGSGEFGDGGRLPAILALAAQYEVAPMTVRKALAALRDEGAVVSVPGWGYFTAERPPDG
jgi:DNA-binding GntR family transcriptional regulator